MRLRVAKMKIPDFKTCASQGLSKALVLCGILLISSLSSAYASPTSQLEKRLAQIFVNHSFTVRSFYRGDRLLYDSTGVLVGKADTGYWSRDGMVLISSVKMDSDDQLKMRGERYCIEFDPATGEFDNVRTGDHVEISIHLQPSQLDLQSAIPVLQKVFVTSHEKLVDIAPSYWTNCLSHKISRGPGKHALWECPASDKPSASQISVAKLVWDIPPPDNTLHDGTQLYVLQHRVAYPDEAGVSPPRAQVAPDPVFRWEERRVRLGQLTCVLSIVVGQDGRAHDIFIVTPVGIGLDDEAVAAVREWRFSPARRGGKPVETHARVVFLVSAPNTVPEVPLRSFVY